MFICSPSHHNTLKWWLQLKQVVIYGSIAALLLATRYRQNPDRSTISVYMFKFKLFSVISLRFVLASWSQVVSLAYWMNMGVRRNVHVKGRSRLLYKSNNCTNNMLLTFLNCFILLTFYYNVYMVLSKVLRSPPWLGWPLWNIYTKQVVTLSSHLWLVTVLTRVALPVTLVA